MRGRIVLAIVPAIILATSAAAACGSNRGQNQPSGDAGRCGRNDQFELCLSTEPAELRTAQPAAFVLTLRNLGSAPVTLSFPSGKSGDVTIGTWRWSQGRMFTQALRREEVAGGGVYTVRLETSSLPVAAGPHPLIANLDVPRAPRVSTQITIR